MRGAKRPRETLVLATFPSNDAPSAEYPHCSHPWAERHPVVIPRDGERNRAWPLAQATHLVCHVSQTRTRGRGVERLTSIHRRTSTVGLPCHRGTPSRPHTCRKLTPSDSPAAHPRALALCRKLAPPRAAKLSPSRRLQRHATGSSAVRLTVSNRRAGEHPRVGP